MVLGPKFNTHTPTKMKFGMAKHITMPNSTQVTQKNAGHIKKQVSSKHKTY